MSFPARTILRALVPVVLAFSVGWLLVPESESPRTLVQARRAAWFLEELPRRTDQTALAARASAAAYWGAIVNPVPVAAGAAEDLAWRVSAIFGSGSDRKLLVSFRAPSLPARTLKVGDKLPSGHVITQIGERDYCVRIGNATFRLGVERSEQ